MTDRIPKSGFGAYILKVGAAKHLPWGGAVLLALGLLGLIRP